MSRLPEHSGRNPVQGGGATVRSTIGVRNAYTQRGSVAFGSCKVCTTEGFQNQIS